MATPPCKPKKKSLNQTQNSMLSTSILAQLLCLALSSQLELSGWTRSQSHACVLFAEDTHSAAAAVYYGGRGISRAQDESTLWVQTLVLQAALQHSVIVILSIQITWGHKSTKRKRQ